MEKRVFGNRYQITERIGIGGMAEVYKATDSTLGRTVAVKVMLPQYAADKTFAARFRQEAQAAANLTSPYIVNIYDWGKDDDMYYIIMEYVRGTDLKSAVQERGSIHPRKVAEIGSQVCSALSVAHSYGIVHRDIKSANIMVQTDGNVKVMDFGIAQAGNTDMTQDTNVLGTAHYVSPEQAQGKPLSGTSDLYSLGVVMYEACTGQLPFDGPDAVSVAMKQVSEMPVPPRQINPAVDPTLEAIILKAMSKDVNGRYATANEMKQALDDYLAGRANPAMATTTVIGAAAGGAAATTVMGTVGGTGGKVTDTRNSKNEPEKKGSGKKKAVIALVIILIIAAIAVGVAAGSGVFAAKSLVPDVTNSTLAEATTTLKNAGLDVGNVSYETSDTVEKDKIISQDPAANEQIANGTKVNLVISQGKAEAEKVTVPNLLNLTDAEAKQALESAGLVGSSSQGYSDEYEKGKVFEQSPAAMGQVPKGSTVTYKISQGKAETLVEVISVIGLDEDDAKSTLEGKGLKVITDTGYSENVGVGQVMDQDISAGTKVSEGTSITITISQGSQTASIPAVLGLSEAKATSRLENAGFEVDVEYDTGTEGQVLSQSPTGGSAKIGSTVTITVGTGTDTEDDNTSKQ